MWQEILKIRPCDGESQRSDVPACATARMSNHLHFRLLVAASAMQRNDAVQSDRELSLTKGRQAAEFRSDGTLQWKLALIERLGRVWQTVTMWDEMKAQLLTSYIQTTLPLCSVWKLVCAGRKIRNCSKSTFKFIDTIQHISFFAMQIF